MYKIFKERIATYNTLSSIDKIHIDLNQLEENNMLSMNRNEFQLIVEILLQVNIIVENESLLNRVLDFKLQLHGT